MGKMMLFGSACFLLFGARMAAAATIAVSPSDSNGYQKIESAQAGDEVVIGPGTYVFRVHLTKVGTADKPIVIRAQDPAHPPVWDLSTTLVENAPGSYTAGDRGRGCWQISGGAYYDISGIVFANCHNAGNNSAGMRYYNGARGIRLRDCIFRGSDNGLTGGSQDSQITVEYSELDGNGTLAASSSAPSHNLYIYGGDFTLRYSYVHDPVQAQNFHIRATTSVIEYNWFARAKSYEGDLMTDDDLSGGSQVSQTMLLRGNVIVQAAQPGNNSQVIAVYNDGGVNGLSFSIRLVNNTFVGNGGHAALVHLSNADATVMHAELVNNIVAGTSVVTAIEDSTSGFVSGSNNWIVTGASAAGLSASVAGTDPGFVNAGAKSFVPAPGSAAIGKAAAAPDLPNAEYYRDEQVTRQRRARATVRDLGAFESTTASDPTGPYGTPALPGIDGGADAPADAPLGVGGIMGTGGGGGGTSGRGGASGAGGASGRGGAIGRGGATGAGGTGVAGRSGGTGGLAGRDAGVGAAGAGGVLGAGGTTASGGTGTAEAPDASVSFGSGGTWGGSDAAAMADGLVVDGPGGAPEPSRGTSSGCGCALGGNRSAALWLPLALLGLVCARGRSRKLERRR